VFCHDEASGLEAIIAIYSTALGPGLGGTRFYPYAAEADAVRDVLNLSKGMAYKAALAGLDLGGGKASSSATRTSTRSEALLRAYGRFVSRSTVATTALRRRDIQRGHGHRGPRVRLRHRSHRRARRAPGTRVC
jgi:glutamate dehydrogenase/leucine dehydrogenase